MVSIKSKSYGCIWKTMFIMSLGYPKNPTLKDKRMYKKFYDSIAYIIPCVHCRNFTQTVLMNKLPLDFTNNETLFESLYIWKDAVNIKLGSKKSPSLRSIRKKYSKLYANCSNSQNKCI